ncbi:hypothetical protein M5D96_008739 [Drosophila gunungcola]|uniref:Odorant receptor n=1 Tax=Drosophila gunungcola TaxID=103775 RepID=A0A9P9YKS6_9MUSC|nr:hypothetical protein M5D96_008739 [Drosophila gunungcola]
MKKPLFERLQAAPVDQPASSVDASDYYYRITFLLGLKPPKEGLARWIYFLWSATVMWLGIVYLPLGLTLTYVLHFDSSLQVDINCIGNVVKSLVTFSQMWRLRRMNELIAPLDARCDTPSQRQILHNVVARVNLIVFIFVSMYLGFGFLNVFTSVLYFVVSIATMQELISDAYPIVFVSLFRGHLAVLKNRIENLRQDPELSEEENYRQLVACIQDHRTIVESAQVIRPILSVTIFAQFMLVGIDLGLAAISILYFPSTIWTIMANVSFILAVCLESFPCCMLCEHLIDDCAHVSDALFHSNWIMNWSVNMVLFELINPAPLTEKVQSRQGNIYLYRAMWLIGWIPPKEGVLRYVYLFWTCVPFAFGVFYLPVGFIISYVCINVYGASVKSTITYLFLWRLRKTEMLLDALDKRLDGDSDHQKIHNMVARCNYAFLIYSFIYCGYAGSTFLSYALSGRPPCLWIQAIVEYITMSFAVLQDQLSDTYPLMFTIQFRAHMDILKDHVRNLRMDPERSEADNYQDLVNCVMDHKMILRCCDMIRPMISRTIFVQFALIGSVLGLTLVNVFFFSNFWKGVASLLFVITILLQTFPFCYTCNLLIDDAQELANTIFQSNWVAKFAFSIITIVRQMNLAEQFQ